MRTKMLRPEFLKEAMALSHEAKLILCEQMFGSEVENDNYGQFIIYTDIIRDDKTHKLRVMREGDL